MIQYWSYKILFASMTSKIHLDFSKVRLPYVSPKNLNVFSFINLSSFCVVKNANLYT